MKNWDVKKLRDLADIRVSNVDKKIYPSERPVKLCNYMDVYTNEYIDGSIQFMEGSANDAEIERFGLNIGDVIITKDSETPDDIGIPTVIHEQIDNLVCGYHLALIRPDNEKIDSIFLSKYLSTSRVANYFALHASGSTRFGLPIGAIESVEILTPPIKEQTQIATILSTIDRAIEQTEALITKQQRIKTGLMQDLLTKGIDENGNIRSEETHKFKDSPLGRIPVEWEVKPLASVAEIIMGQSPQGYTYNQIGEGTPLINGPTEFGTRYIERVNQWTTSPTKLCKRGDVLFCVRGSTTGRINIANDVYCIGRGLAAIREVKNKSINSFLELFLTQLVEQLFSEASGSGSTFPSITSNRLSATLILVPSIEEQNQIVLIINSYDRHICTEETHLNKLHSL